MGVNVGSEALYRKEIDPNVLAKYIYDVKGMTQIAYKATHVPVGSADTWTSWVDGRNKPVIDASDVILMNAFPVCFSIPPFPPAVANDIPNSIGKGWKLKLASRLSSKPLPTLGTPSGLTSHSSLVKLGGQQPGPITRKRLHASHASRSTTPKLRAGFRSKALAGTGSLVLMSQRGNLRLRGTLVLLGMDRPQRSRSLALSRHGICLVWLVHQVWFPQALDERIRWITTVLICIATALGLISREHYWVPGLGAWYGHALLAKIRLLEDRWYLWSSPG